MYDVIIVGAGAAGMAAAVYTTRKKLKTLVISIDVGGQTLLTNHIENYPGYGSETPGYPSGPRLMQIFEKQARHFGADFVFGKAVKLEKKEKDKKLSFTLTLSNGEKYVSRTLILTYGKVPRSLGIPGEEKFIGRGVSTCATCDAPVFEGKTTAVVGGGNSGVEAAELLSKFATKVYLVHRRDEFRADEITIEKVKKLKNVELVLSHVPVEIKGDKLVTGLVVESVKTGAKKELRVDGVFVEIGYIIDTSLIKGLVELTKANEIVVNDRCETSHPGIFAAGDLTIVPYKQTIIAAGDGAKAGLQAYAYLQTLEGKPVVKLDWT